MGRRWLVACWASVAIISLTACSSDGRATDKQVADARPLGFVTDRDIGRPIGEKVERLIGVRADCAKVKATLMASGWTKAAPDDFVNGTSGAEVAVLAPDAASSKGLSDSAVAATRCYLNFLPN